MSLKSILGLDEESPVGRDLPLVLLALHVEDRPSATTVTEERFARIPSIGEHIEQDGLVYRVLYVVHFPFDSLVPNDLQAEIHAVQVPRAAMIGRTGNDQPTRRRRRRGRRLQLIGPKSGV